MLRTALLLIVGSSAVLVWCLPPQTSTTTPKSNARLCPNGKAYHNQTQSCYNVRERGPCGKFMTFGFTTNGSEELLGQCSCRKFEDIGCATRPLVYWPENNSCYPIFDKGPCKSQEWLTVDENGHPLCQKNKCQNFLLFGDDDEDEEDAAAETAPPKLVNFSYKGKCYKSETQGFCKDGEKVYFVEGSFLPECYSDQDHPVCVKTVLFSLSSIPIGDCAEGKRISNGECVETVDFA